jgi:hypothetical protein
MGSWTSWFTGAPTAGQIGQDTSGVQNQSQSAYQIGGLSQYLSGLNGLQGQSGALTNALPGQTQQDMANQAQMAQYLQNVGMGTQQTAGDVALQQGQQTAARNLQSGIASSQGMSPALQQRQLMNAQATNAGNVAGQAAQQKLGEQFQGAQGALGANQNLNQETLQNYGAQQSGLNQQAQLAGQQNAGQVQQSQFNQAYAQQQQALQQWQAQQAINQQMAQAQGENGLLKSGISGAATMGAGALTNFAKPAAGLIPK